MFGAVFLFVFSTLEAMAIYVVKQACDNDITYIYFIYIYLSKIMLLRENLPFMAEFFNPHQKLCQGTND